jgi:hypothetical protein
MSTTADADCLKLVKDRSGTVWFCQGEAAPRSSGLTYASFVRSALLRRGSSVRVIGSADNADIILDLWHRRVRGNLKMVQLCSPAVVDPFCVPDDPTTALYSMRAYGNVPSLGGWRDVEATDIATFRIAASKAFDRGLLAAHPITRSMTFVAGLDETALFDLIAAVIDPRWHVDPSDPDSQKPLMKFLGLSHDIYTRLQSHQLPCSDAERRGGRVRDAWISGRSAGTQAPGAFVLRAGLNLLKPVLCDLFSSMEFVRFMRGVWLNCLDGTHKGRLFCPEYFFTNPRVLEAYRGHAGLATPDRATRDFG